jgi:NAD(P)-dependent dehydrogenase (short-subunit alcohol dehydrogenase family)
MVAFHGANVVVTGGTGALGTAVVERLLAAGAVCHIPNLHAHEIDRFALRDNPGVHIVRDIELSDEASVKKFYAGVPSLWASIHLAGGFAMAPVAETSSADMTAQFRMNTLSAFLCSAAAIGGIRARGGPGPEGRNGGRIVNVSARPALEPRLGAGMAAYAATKAGVAVLTQALAEEVATEEIWINAVAPSILNTPANRAAMPDANHSLWVGTDAIADLIAFLASPDNRVTRGAVIPVYAGV